MRERMVASEIVVARPDRTHAALSRLEASCAAGTTAASFAATLPPQLRALAGPTCV